MFFENFSKKDVYLNFISFCISLTILSMILTTPAEVRIVLFTVSLSVVLSTPVIIKVLPSLTRIVPLSNLLVASKSIVPQLVIFRCSEAAVIAGEIAKVTKPLSSIF